MKELRRLVLFIPISLLFCLASCEDKELEAKRVEKDKVIKTLNLASEEAYAGLEKIRVQDPSKALAEANKKIRENDILIEESETSLRSLKGEESKANKVLSDYKSNYPIVK